MENSRVDPNQEFPSNDPGPFLGVALCFVCPGRSTKSALERLVKTAGVVVAEAQADRT